MKKLLILLLVLTQFCNAEPQMLVLKNPQVAQLIITNWLTAHGYTYQLSTTPAGSVVVISEGAKALFQDVTKDLKNFDSRLTGLSIQGPVTSIVLNRIKP